MGIHELIWREVEGNVSQPARCTGFEMIPFDRFAQLVAEEDEEFARYAIETIQLGKCWILRGAFTEAWMRRLKADTLAWTRSRPSSFHKMVDGVPDFHRKIDLEAGRKYAFGQCKHSAYFFRWNSDPVGLWPETTRVWRPIKQVLGMTPDAYEDNLPSDGATDRAQVVRYPPSVGFLAPHQDPWQHQRCFISAYMSKAGVDFKGGGFYLVGPGDQVVEAESHINVGDACIAHASVVHGVAPCDRGKPVDWDGEDGRWFFGLYSNSPDTGVQRNEGKLAPVDIPGAWPDGWSDTVSR